MPAVPVLMMLQVGRFPYYYTSLYIEIKRIEN